MTTTAYGGRNRSNRLAGECVLALVLSGIVIGGGSVLPTETQGVHEIAFADPPHAAAVGSDPSGSYPRLSAGAQAGPMPPASRKSAALAPLDQTGLESILLTSSHAERSAPGPVQPRLTYTTTNWLAYDSSDLSFFVTAPPSTVDVIPLGGPVSTAIAVGMAPFGVAYDNWSKDVFVTN